MIHSHSPIPASSRWNHPLAWFLGWVILGFSESAAGFIWLLLMPDHPGQPFIASFSMKQWALLVGFVLLGSAWLAAGLGRANLARVGGRWLRESKWVRRGVWVLYTGLFLLITIFFLLTFFTDQLTIASLLEWLAVTRKLKPVWIFGLMGLLQTFIFLSFLLNRPADRVRVPQARHLKWTLILFGAGILLAGGITLTGLELPPRDAARIVRWGIPVQLWQLGMMFLYLLLLRQFNSAVRSGLLNRMDAERARRAAKWLDGAVFLLVWGLALAAWLQVPFSYAVNTYYYQDHLPPNFDLVPWSDARVYDLGALKILYGNLNEGVLTRPLYAILIAGYHLFSGLDYQKLISAQTALLALVPAVFYLLGKRIHSRGLGLGLALLTIYREINTIHAAPLVSASNSKLLLSELPTVLLLALFAWAFIIWLRDRREQWTAALLAGAMLGLGLLMRTNLLLIVPPVLAVIVFAYRRELRRMVPFLLMFLLGVMIVIAPILIRNFTLTGQITFDDPRYVQSNLKLLDPNAHSAASSGLLAAVLANPLEIARQTVSHFLNSLASSFFSLPTRAGTSATDPSGLILLDDTAQMRWGDVLLMLMNMFLIARGAARLFHHDSISALTLLLLYGFYNLSTAWSGLSGWRFILPVDWALQIFFILGVVSLIPRVQPAGTEEPHARGGRYSLRWLALAGVAVVVLVGCVLPLRAGWFPAPNANLTREQICAEWNQLPGAEPLDCANMDDSEQVLVRGMAFYPVYAGEGKMIKDSEKNTIYQPQPFGRLIFEVVGSQSQRAFLPTDQADLDLRGGDEVILLARQTSLGWAVESLWNQRAGEWAHGQMVELP
ncbi:MAG: glycosyltransferase family 39 protein [Anaerolineaceae bacterium]|nr:glycosyltransferase family 39 protein [Anaerolineaceae bacterium]